MEKILIFSIGVLVAKAHESGESRRHSVERGDYIRALKGNQVEVIDTLLQSMDFTKP